MQLEIWSPQLWLLVIVVCWLSAKPSEDLVVQLKDLVVFYETEFEMLILDYGFLKLPRFYDTLYFCTGDIWQSAEFSWTSRDY